MTVSPDENVLFLAPCFLLNCRSILVFFSMVGGGLKASSGVLIFRPSISSAGDFPSMALGFGVIL
jgi:hypothetical protein